LEISIRTVEKHVARICRKLDRDRRELVGCRSYSLEG
jgi:DNA-binding CsgD family transcriptional regulator